MKHASREDAQKGNSLMKLPPPQRRRQMKRIEPRPMPQPDTRDYDYSMAPAPKLSALKNLRMSMMKYKKR